MAEATNGLSQRDIKGATKYCFNFYSWFSLKNLAEYAMDVCVDIIVMVKNKYKSILQREY